MTGLLPEVLMAACVCHFLLLLAIVGGALSMDSFQFVREEMCDVEESVKRGCSREMDGPSDMMQCARTCWSDTECVGASLDARGSCLHHQLCHTSVPCPGPDAIRNTHRYMARYCVHGTWDRSIRSCVCRYGAFGVRCNRYHSDCDGLGEDGYGLGLHESILDPLQDGANLIRVICWFTKQIDGRIRFLSNPNEVNYFNRTWNEYVNGIIVDGQTKWGGLRALHLLGKTGFTKLSVNIGSSGKSVYGVYTNFTIGSEDSGYSLLSGFTFSSHKQRNPPAGMKAGDCLSPLQGMPFSTWDRGQVDSRGENCASLAGSGWWYKGGNCDIPCNLLGLSLPNYEATPPRQRMTHTGVDFTAHSSWVDYVFMTIEKF